MTEFMLTLEKDFTYEQMKEKFESITREYSLSVIEGINEGNSYPDAADNLRFLHDIIFDITFTIEDQKPKS